jgi:hypothetical protein
LLWQILRPFVSDNDEFDKAFAETFALPEFSLGRGGAQRAAARMASILASYSDIPEETASKMLANDLLIAELQTKRTDAEFAETIESAVAAENAQLIEERAALAAQLESEKAGREAKQRELDAAAEQIRVREQSLEQKDQILREKEEAIQSLQAEKTSQVELAEKAAQRVIKEHQEKEEAKRRATELEQTALLAEQRAVRITKIASVIIGLLAVGFPLKDYPPSPGLRWTGSRQTSPLPPFPPVQLWGPLARLRRQTRQDLAPPEKTPLLNF